MTHDEENMARMAIRHTQSVYNNTGDRGKIAEMVTTFAERGELDTESGKFVGRDAICEFLTRVATGQTPTDLSGSRHNLTTSRIEFTSDTTADGWTYFFVSRKGTIIEEGLYIDHYVKEGDRWLISYRRVKDSYSVIRSDRQTV
jgi:hypothetical protein